MSKTWDTASHIAHLGDYLVQSLAVFDDPRFGVPQKLPGNFRSAQNDLAASQQSSSHRPLKKVGIGGISHACRLIGRNQAMFGDRNQKNI